MKAKEPRQKYRQAEYGKIHKARLILEDEHGKTKYSISLEPFQAQQIWAEIDRKEQAINPNKVVMATIYPINLKTPIQFFVYRDNPEYWFLNVEQDTFKVPFDQWRRLFPLASKLRNFFGINHKEKAKKWVRKT